ncbi:GntR family transcriptional regulator [Novosphingobium umbonatum]|uniref:GntR family transcriptional regulator n=2 Tax=Novosphingobium umbonatum TaxID=1908524 RepID=A0A3S2UQ26_9SPHN|nr:GntR family transcriptional regulator [Novosphingobium umbonatum]
MKSAGTKKSTKTPATKGKIPAASLSREAVVEAVRQSIFQGRLVPGQRLVEAEICEALNASRGNVRTALMDLEHEGLVERIANRGARVRIVPLEEALHIVEVRMAVESLCVARAAERITPEDRIELQALAQQLTEKAEQGDVDGYADTTRSVFETYLRMANQPVAAEVLAKLRARNTRHRYRLTYRKDRAKVSLPYWLEIIAAICAGDPAAAEAALRAHAQNVQETMKALAEAEQPFAGLTPLSG